MALLDGKQLRNDSTSLDKLQGHSGLVTFTASATMSFSGASITRDTADILVATDVVNKEYVDSVAAGLDPKESVRVIATASITLSGTQSIDGYLLSVGDRVLVNGQGSAADNGIYDVAAGAWSRSSDSDGTPANEVSLGNFTFVEFGTVYSGSGWVLSNTNASNPDEIDPGVETQQWVQFSAAGAYTAGTGLSLVGSEFSITDTAVSAGSYGGADETVSFTVNAQGQLTSASTQSISITSGQVSDFTTAVNNEVFDASNFLDSSTIDFNVTAGATVSADVIDGSLGTGKLDSNGGATAGYVLESNGDGTFNWVQPTTGDITGVTAGAGLTGGGDSGAVTLDVNTDNGLEIQSDYVGLGGTLNRNTTIDAATYDLTIGDAGTILMTASSFDVEADGFVSIDAGTGSAQYLADGTITISASNSVDVVSTGGVFVQGASFSVNNVEIDPTSPSTGYVLTYDGTKFAPAAVAGTGDITEVNAGAGLTGGATQGAATLDVELTTNGGITFSASGANGTLEVDEANLDYTTMASNLQGNGLTANAGVLDVNVGTGLVINSDVVEADFTTLASNLQGNGLTANSGVLDVNVDAAALEITSDVVRLKDTITGDRTFTGNVVINSNLTVSGTATYVNTENLYVEDNIITLNATYSGAPLLDSGLEVNRGTGTYSKLIWDESLDYWVAGLSGSESIIIQEAGTGLTKTNNELSLDFTSVADNLEGAGLTSSGGVLNVGAGTGITVNADDVEVNFTEVAENLQGAGLTAAAGVVNVGAGTGIIVNADDVAIDFNSITGDGLTQSGGVINVDYTTVADNVQGQGLTSSGGVLNADITAQGGLTFSAAGDTGTLEVEVDGVTIIVNGAGQLEATTSGDISGVTAGAGLSGGGNSGFLQLDVELTTNGGLTFSGAGDAGTLEVDEANLEYTTIASNLQGNGLTANSGVLDVNTGNGLTINSDVVEADLLSNGGLTFSGGQITALVDNTTISINGSGQLQSIGGAAQVYYGDRNLTPSTTAPNTNNEDSGLTIANTPHDYSRVNVYVNGQLQFLGDGSTAGDCYFGATSGSAEAITSIASGQTLWWNGSNAGFRLTTSDRIDIIYEI